MTNANGGGIAVAAVAAVVGAAALVGSAPACVDELDVDALDSEQAVA
jgi:hypothetical protein